MRTFTDSKGHQWKLDVNAGVLMDIQSEMGLNLLDEPEAIPDSAKKIVGILWITCMEQAIEKDISPQQFARGLSGPVLQVAFDTWMREYSDFFVHLSPARGQVISALWEKAKELEASKVKVLAKVLRSTSTDWQELLTKIQGD